MLSALAVGGAAAARGVADRMLPVLFPASLGLLAYAHYLFWWRGRGCGRKLTGWVLLVSTIAAVYLWCGRVYVWAERWLD